MSITDHKLTCSIEKKGGLESSLYNLLFGNGKDQTSLTPIFKIDIISKLNTHEYKYILN